MDTLVLWVSIGNSEIGEHSRSNLCYSICLRRLSTSRTITSRIFTSENAYFLVACATCSELPSNIGTML